MTDAPISHNAPTARIQTAPRHAGSGHFFPASDRPVLFERDGGFTLARGFFNAEIGDWGY